MRNTTRVLTRSALFLAAALSLPACDLLTVDNPNNIVEESLANVQAATAIVNGAEATLARGHGQMIPVYSTLRRHSSAPISGCSAGASFLRCFSERK